MVAKTAKLKEIPPKLNTAGISELAINNPEAMQSLPYLTGNMAALAKAGYDPVGLIAEMAAMQEQIGQLQATVNEFTEKIGRLETTLETAQNINVTIAGENADLCHENQQLRQKISRIQPPSITSPEDTSDLLGQVQSERTMIRRKREIGSPSDLKTLLEANPDEMVGPDFVDIYGYLTNLPVIGNIFRDLSGNLLTYKDVHKAIVSELNKFNFFQTIQDSREIGDYFAADIISKMLQSFVLLSTECHKKLFSLGTNMLGLSGVFSGSLTGEGYSFTTDVGVGRKKISFGVNAGNANLIKQEFGQTETEIKLINEDSAGHAKLNDGTEIDIVCDGMGGHGQGEEASRMAVGIYLHARLGGKDIFQSIQLVQDCILKQNESLGGKNRKGTTFVATERSDDGIRIIQIGDSRARYVSQDSAGVVTRDHAKKFELCEIGVFSEQLRLEDPTISPFIMNEKDSDGNYTIPKTIIDDQAMAQFEDYSYPENNVITTGLGINKDLLLVNYFYFPKLASLEKTTSRVMLYSDGVVKGRAIGCSRAQSESDLTRLTRDHDNLLDLSRRIVEEAVAKGSDDNVTVGVVELPYELDIQNRSFGKFNLSDGKWTFYEGYVGMTRTKKESEILPRRKRLGIF
ncbi:MAG: Protein serine threonine phosphatase PrpC regulation of stationary phase [Candidatus Saganbacteria bacterium]|uniref:Protein serine threonine phosphatase PrpC regulation of stationary phase n=1 Tax=Candidatus Saganbacteria bacterium TaxID=2575572 RepID=A0A833L035_UNCSA|nr:MAG: Protein serine threonine phosphatase PrpC regulation of stationary phase [Candidatus Saganbacteria bacterium]